MGEVVTVLVVERRVVAQGHYLYELFLLFYEFAACLHFIPLLMVLRALLDVRLEEQVLLGERVHLR